MLEIDQLHPDRSHSSCHHVPQRYYQRTFDSIDTTVGKAVRLAVKAGQQLAAGEVQGLLITGPVGCGKSLIASAASNAIAIELQRAFHEAQAESKKAESSAAEARGQADDAYRLNRDAEQIAMGVVPDPLATLYAEAAERFRAFDIDPQRDYEKLKAKQVAAMDWEAKAKELSRRTKYAAQHECPQWFNVPFYLGQLRRSFSAGQADHEDTSTMIDHRGLVVLDDLGAEKPTEWTAATLFEGMSMRYDQKLPTLVTSNLSVRDLMSAGYERIVSRLADEGAIVEMATATDYRMRLRRRLTA